MKVYEKQREDGKVGGVFRHTETLIKDNVNKTYEEGPKGPTAVSCGLNACI